MAHVIGPNQQHIHLISSHIFGRLASAVDTQLTDVAVSRIHFVIEYKDEQWWLVDFSRNGTWLNGGKLAPNQRQVLALNDVISLGADQNITFIVAKLGEPTDLLCRRKDPGLPVLETIELNDPLVIDTPQGEVIAEKVQPSNTNSGTWCFRQVSQQQQVSDQEWIEINGIRWQLWCANQAENTAQQPLANITLASVKYSLYTSLDEETTRAMLTVAGNETAFDARNHHYLLLLLARQLVEDTNNNVDKTERGWIYTEQLMTMLGMSETLINIQIYRARQQFDQVLGGYLRSSDLIIRRRGQVRLGFQQLEIYKGDSLEQRMD